MPQASDADRNRYCETFPDIGCEHAIAELKRRGWTLRSDWSWEAPADQAPTGDELFWVGFLVNEWDFGGIWNALERR